MLTNTHVLVLIFSNILFTFAALLFLNMNNVEMDLFSIACGGEVHAELQQDNHSP